MKRNAVANTNCRKKDFEKSERKRMQIPERISNKKIYTHTFELSPRETTEINAGRCGKKEELPGGVSRKEKSQKWRKAYIA